jgi:hypothetical protein
MTVALESLFEHSIEMMNYILESVIGGKISFMRTPVSIGEWDEKSFDGVRGKSRSRSYIK